MFNVNDGEQLAVAIDDLVTRSEIFQKYLREYFVQDEFESHLELIRHTAVRVSANVPEQLRGVYLSGEAAWKVDDSILERALYLLITSGRIKPKKAAAAPLEETPVDTRPRDKTGRPMSPKAIQWQKWEQWCNDPKNPPSMREIETKRKTDPAFAEFYEHQSALRRKEQPTDGFDPEAAKAAAGPELTAFAESYNRAPVASLKPINGVVTLNGQKYPKGAFDALVDAASAARLIF